MCVSPGPISRVRQVVLPSVAVLAALLLTAALVMFNPGGSEAADAAVLRTVADYSVLAASTSEIPSRPEVPTAGDGFVPVMLGAGAVLVLLGVGILFLFRREHGGS